MMSQIYLKKEQVFTTLELKKLQHIKVNILKDKKIEYQKIDINIPRQGQTFKSEDLFVDMSKR